MDDPLAGTAPPESAPRTGGTRRACTALGLVAAGLFLLLTTVNLDAQAPYYDELHQATGAFLWVGAGTPMFCEARLGRFCLLNMSYSGAIKTNLYGAYLRLTGHRFSLPSWRLFAIIPVAAAIVLFATMVYPALGAGSLAVVLVLLVTDVNVILNTRFDSGPVALSLVARLVLVALWIRGDVTAAGATPRNSLALGAITGLAVFEKLSAVVLIAGLLAALLGPGGRRTPRHAAAMSAGLGLGLAPLVAINAFTLATEGAVVSLTDVATRDTASGGFLVHLGRYLSLGQGAAAKVSILAAATPAWALRAEGALVAGLAALVAVAAIGSGACRRLRLAGVMLVTYGAIAIGLYLLPRRIKFHHLALGTPYQYAAVGLALAAAGWSLRSSAALRAVRPLLVILVAALFGLRVVAVWPVEARLARGTAGLAYDASLRDIALFAAARRDTAVFVASDWGVATQIYAYSGGDAGLVFEPFWRYAGVRELHEFQRRAGKDVLYVVRLRRPEMVRAEATRRIEYDLATDGAWQEVEPEPEVRDLHAVFVQKYVYRPAVAPGR